MSLVARHDIDFVTLDSFLENRRWLTIDHPLPQLRGHSLHVIFVEIQFPGNLGVREVQPHEIQA